MKVEVDDAVEWIEKNIECYPADIWKGFKEEFIADFKEAMEKIAIPF